MINSWDRVRPVATSSRVIASASALSTPASVSRCRAAANDARIDPCPAMASSLGDLR
jgi:hypothetical protein